MFNNLGIEWAATLLGCLAALCVPIPVLFYLYGKKLRQKSKFAPTMTIKKADPDEETDEDDDHADNFAALHATKSKAHHDLPTKSRTRASRASGPNGNVLDDVEKNLTGNRQTKKEE
jgi:hypothetical protein